MSDEMQVQTKGLNKMFLFIAIAVIAVGLVAALVLLPTSAKAKKVEEQLSLGAKYLSELDYEQAIVAYEAVIKIDPKCEKAYLALADIYIATGAFEKAEAILKQAEEAIGKDAQFLEEKRQEVSVGQKQAESTPVPSPTAIPTPEPTATPTSTPTPTSEPSPTPNVIPTEDDSEKVKEVFDIQITTDGVDVIAENLKVTQDYITNEIRVTISGILLQDSYTINKRTSDMNRLEYGWCVSMQSEKYKYEVATTSWASESGNEMVCQVADMQHSVWGIGDEGGSHIGWAEMQYTSDSLTWIFIMPEGYELDIREIQKYEVSITEECNTIETREYSQSGNISVITLSPIPTVTPTPTEIPMGWKEYDGTTVELSKAKVGDVVLFGAYEQDNITSNGAEAIPWYVLDKDGDKLLLMSVYLLDCVKYHEEWVDITWEACTLRQWMNDDFYNSAFTASEKNYIRTSYLENADNPYYGTEGGNDTEDKVFALSLAEAEQYFGIAEDWGDFWYSATPELSAAKVTAYAEEQGADVSDYESTAGNGWFWLRSPGVSLDDAAYVISDGDVSVDGAYVVYSAHAARPALWLNLNP